VFVAKQKVWNDITRPNSHGGGLRGRIKGNGARVENKGTSTASIIFVNFIIK
jgi:hypothetical protein